MTTVTVRYFVHDLEGSVAFYRDLLDFEVELVPSPMFAMLYRGDLRLLLSVPEGGILQPPGWNRFALEFPDVEASVADLRSRGASFDGEIVTGVGVKRAVLLDPDGNPVELFEPMAAYHERAST